MNGNRADLGGAASAGRKSVGCTSIPAQRRAVKAIPIDDVEQIACGRKGDSRWNSDALILCEDVAFALRRHVPALSGMPLLESRRSSNVRSIESSRTPFVEPFGTSSRALSPTSTNSRLNTPHAAAARG